MKGLSIQLPYSALIAEGRKTLEIRSRPTKYRGRILICNSQKISPNVVKVDDPAAGEQTGFEWRIPVCDNYMKVEYLQSVVNSQLWLPGHAIATADLIDCRPFDPQDVGSAYCNYYPGYYAWALSNVTPIVPIQIKGYLGLFNIPPGLMSMIVETHDHLPF